MQVTPHQMFTGEHPEHKTTGKPLLVGKVSKAVTQLSETDKTLWNFGDLSSFDDRQEPFFVDWLTMRQTHDFEVPIVNCGVVFGVDPNGQVEWQTQRPRKIEGSFDTSVQIRSDGYNVMFSGNVSLGAVCR